MIAFMIQCRTPPSLWGPAIPIGYLCTPAPRATAPVPQAEEAHLFSEANLANLRGKSHGFLVENFLDFGSRIRIWDDIGISI